MAERDLTPIPIPARQQWREFRVVYLPIFMFAGLVLVIGWMWRNYVQPPTIIGEVETVRSQIITISAGTLQDLKVDRLASVTNGQELATITLLEPAQIQAEATAVEAELRLMKSRMDLDRTRNINAYSQLRADLEIEKLNLESAKIRLVQSENELGRSKQLIENNLMAYGVGSTRNDFGYDVAVRDRDTMIATLAARQKTVAELKAGVEALEAAGASKMQPTDPIIEQSIVAQRARLESLQGSVVLRSPIDGFVSVINQLPGARVGSGDAILVISAEKSDRIIAWVRQPVTSRPKVGDIVEVRRGTLGQQSFEARVVKVGKQLEEINATAVPLNATLQRAEFGLPLIVKVEQQLDLIPGEAVQLRVIKSPN
jgi:multidrug resistance efflux pump